MKACNTLTSEFGFELDMAVEAIHECGPDNISACVDWIKAKGVSPNTPELVSINLITADQTLDKGGTVIAETAVKQYGNFHIGGHSYTLKTAGRKETDTYWCSYHRSCNCPVKLWFNRQTGTANLHTTDGSPVKHTEKCQERNMSKARDDASDRSQLCSASPIATNVDDEVKQMIDELAVGNLNALPVNIWKELVKALNTKYPNGWFGIDRHTAIRRVYTARNNHLGNGDLYRMIEHPLWKNVPDTGQPFLQANLAIPNPKDVTKVHRIIVFGHPTLMMLLNGRVDAFIDATFKVVPVGFYQLLVVMVKDLQTQMFVPVFYCLMTGKSKSLYSQALHFIISATNCKFNPRRISCDFEAALIAEVRNKFSPPDSGSSSSEYVGTDIVGCKFHLKQAWHRKMKELRISRQQIGIAMLPGVLDILCVLPPDELMRKGIHYVRSLVEKLIKEKIGRELTLKEKTLWNSFFWYLRREWLTDNKRPLWTKYRMVSISFVR